MPKIETTDLPTTETHRRISAREKFGLEPGASDLPRGMALGCVLPLWRVGLAAALA
jgi:hypothetical protein